ncbi:MAG: transposase [Clostridia bacterium]|nr:transposase [Clostridia bacterium]
MHTFGRDLKWNPHVHALCTQDAADRNGFWHNFTYIDYKYLHIVFMQKLIALLRKHFKGNKLCPFGDVIMRSSFCFHAVCMQF